MKFRFDSAFSHQRASEAISKICEISKQKDLFTFDYSNKLIAEAGGSIQVMNEVKMVQTVMAEFERLGVFETQGKALFNKVEMDNQTRIKRKIDWPAHVIVPSCLNPDDHLRCGFSRFNCRFPILSYYNKKLGFSIWRSSQLSIDSSSSRSKDDETFIRGLNQSSDLNQHLHIFNPISKKAGRSFQIENPVFYDRTKQMMYGLSDIKVVGQAFEQIWNVYQSLQTESTKVMAKVEKSKWLKLIHKFIKTAIKV